MPWKATTPMTVETSQAGKKTPSTSSVGAQPAGAAKTRVLAMRWIRRSPCPIVLVCGLCDRLVRLNGVCRLLCLVLFLGQFWRVL